MGETAVTDTSSASPTWHIPSTTPTEVPNARTNDSSTLSTGDSPLEVAPAFTTARTDGEQMHAITDELNRQGALPAEHEGLRQEIGKRSLMQPRTYALNHDATPMLQTYAREGCPVDCGPDWSSDQIKALLIRGPHKSALSKKAISFLRNETADKVSEKYAKIVTWGEIKDNIPQRLKISPVAMVPHKSKSFRCILDLSFGLRVGKHRYKSINETTNPQARQESMLQLGKTLRRIIYTMEANRHKNKQFYFTKLDIKDGFWRLAVNDVDAWNFAYVLPSTDPNIAIDDIEIVVPNSLQMGWSESPPFFCSASETGRDVIDKLLNDEIELPEHLFEARMFDPTIQYVAPPSKRSETTTLIEVYVDDFIAMTNDISHPNLLRISRAMLHGIHSIFPPPAVTGHTGGDPIAEKKIAKGEGLWQPVKEILGWIIDGENFTLQLPKDKTEKIAQLTKKVLRSKAAPLKRFQELAGKLQHASFGIPGGKGMFSPIYAAMKGDPEFVTITSNLRRTLEDWRTMVQHFHRHPTPTRLLVAGDPHIVQYTDACRLGAGGVVTSGLLHTYPIVWQVEWPDSIKALFDTLVLTINDLELAGMLLGWMVLDDLAPSLEFMHIGMFADNTSAISWVHKGSTTTSSAAGALLRFLHLRMRERRASSCIPIHIAGNQNDMADISSRAFKSGKYFHAKTNLTNYFNTHFKQSTSWTEYTHPSAWVSRVISSLLGTPLPMASLQRLPMKDKNTGPTGQPIATTSSSVQLFRAPQSSLPSLQPQHSVLGSGRVVSAMETRSKFRPYLRRFQPLPRPSNWLAQQVPSSKTQPNTLPQSKDS